jgi:hypothetical protein|tara:strand:+ start:348 stop:632 length:285 start_codon:yes stop_codon:yes gene_type:complete
MKNIVITTLMLFSLSIVTLISCSNTDTWTGWVYPDESNLFDSRMIGNFSSLEGCRISAQSEIKSNNWINADYECGLNCKYNEEIGVNVCKETSR